MQNMISFVFHDHPIRVTDRNGDAWFVARDVAKSLGYKNPEKAIRDHCKGVREILLPSNGGAQKIKIIPEADVYRLIFRSKMPKAEELVDFVAEEILPAIRKTGRYDTNDPTLTAELRNDIEGRARGLADDVYSSYLEEMTKAALTHVRERRPIVIDDLPYLPIMKRRYRRGRLLTADQATMIRREYDTGDYTQEEIGAKYGVSRSLVAQIVNGFRYQDCGRSFPPSPVIADRGPTGAPFLPDVAPVVVMEAILETCEAINSALTRFKTAEEGQASQATPA